MEFEKEEVFQSILLKNSYRKFCGKVKYTGNCSNPWTLEEGFLTSILFYRKIHFNSYKKKKKSSPEKLVFQFPCPFGMVLLQILILSLFLVHGSLSPLSRYHQAVLLILQPKWCQGRAFA